MSIYKFIKEKDETNRFDNTRVEVEVDDVCLPEIIKAFEDFLRGCGFAFDGELDIVEDDLKPLKNGEENAND